ncbi:HTH-type transcriptional activator RhaR [Paenibacillus sp. CECT 9249]|uniref:helix-turn-helix domain-containing protein n=1 Tax=Paenibacillus sp. CECT 9249 TaxID=2845385 RepID=UPI001E4E14A2|nr:AraC family transcriptional regulator [Paenibacillus sp. CECT 9249]CAH0121666.1 HTH-type transcriptional activator RhaR [Paenibacillus sp. CECT 9249]
MDASAFSHFSTGTIIARDNDHVVYRLDPKDGQGNASVYSVLPGVEVISFHFQTSRYIPTLHSKRNILELNHCQEGRAECRMKDGCLQYIGEGDLFMNTMSNHSHCIELPLGHYKGINITIDLEKLTGQLAEYLPDFPIDVSELANRFFVNDECYFIQAKEEIQHIFCGMYSVPIEARTAYYRLKVLEVLFYLYYFDVAGENQKKFYARQQVDTIKQIKKKMTEEIDRRFTIEELAQQYCISPTVLKATFKGVYGVSIAAYMKEHRVRQAASMLLQTRQSIGDIASAVGYKSQSKFGAAFKEIYNMSPLEYRSKYESK